MSTKRLARTVLEGGRAHYNQWARRHSARELRAAERVYLDRLRVDPEAFEALAPPVRRPVYKGFYDKLAPVERWLRAQVGRPWDDVRSEIAARFDVRSLAGQHIVFDHLLPEVDRGESTRGGWRVHRRGTFHVDAEGTLRFTLRVRERRAVEPWPVRSPRLVAWAGLRRVAFVDQTLRWFERTSQPQSSIERVRWRQGVALTVAERAFYARLGPNERLAVTLFVDPIDGKWRSVDGQYRGFAFPWLPEDGGRRRVHQAACRERG
ncbi:MAG: hypothetical protein H6722_05235 [Sandaracinus sp.]|nr:hypothetical protein [Sandaracinus sp.]MCB9611843.1 hypothetical protein [Sandaracinus sp.]MCB9619614.1 hypothetical protein [Sandaracinus sp.]MCB9624544.1 hypothetical protein [Sandaracinus sp.]